jgi:hypothetical protein
MKVLIIESLPFGSKAEVIKQKVADRMRCGNPVHANDAWVRLLNSIGLRFPFLIRFGFQCKQIGID